MHQLLRIYAHRLETEGCVRPGRVAIACRNERISTIGPRDLAPLATDLLERLPGAAVVLAEPQLPYPQLLLKRAWPVLSPLVPNDSESRSFLHDIPLVDAKDKTLIPGTLAAVLARRKGCIIGKLGLVAQGALTVEQAYIAYSSLYHACFIKYLEDLLRDGCQLPDESTDQIVQRHLTPTGMVIPAFQNGPFEGAEQIMSELATVGRATVEMGLVDSFFGNISYAGPDALYISQTAARLDALEHQIDPIPYDCSSTAGITSSSELPAHQAIVKATGCRAVLHGHPRFPVVMSFFSNQTEHEGIDQVCGIPVVGGEGGQGGLSRTVSHAFCLTRARAVIVRGHGVFSIGQNDFREAFAALVATEQHCRQEYCRRLVEQWG